MMEIEGARELVKATIQNGQLVCLRNVVCFKFNIFNLCISKGLVFLLNYHKIMIIDRVVLDLRKILIAIVFLKSFTYFNKKIILN